MNSANVRPLLGLLGVLVAALSADLNEFVSSAALIDVRGALGISADPGLWIDSLYVTGTALGMAFAPWNAVTFTLRRFTLFAIGLACAATTLLAFASNLQAILNPSADPGSERRFDDSRAHDHGLARTGAIDQALRACNLCADDHILTQYQHFFRRHLD
jgi:hypothetical protein